MMPDLRAMTTEQKAMMWDHVVGATWQGLQVETTWMHDGDFTAVVLLPLAFGEAQVQPTVLRAMAVSAMHEADALDAQHRGIPRQPNPDAPVLVVGGEDMTPLEDAMFRVGLAPVVFRDPSAVVLFPGSFAVTGQTMRAFARLAEGQARAIEVHYPPTNGGLPPQRTGPQGPQRDALFTGHLAQPKPLGAWPAEPPQYDVAGLPGDEVDYTAMPVTRASVPELPPPAERAKRQPRGPQAKVAQRTGPLSMGTPDGQGMPVHVPDPIEERVPTKNPQRR